MRAPYVFKGTFLVMRKKNFALDELVRLEWQDPRRTTAIMDAGAGPSVARKDLLAPGWRDAFKGARKSAHVCQGLGHLLRTLGLKELSVIVNDRAMQFEVLVVRGRRSL